MCHPIPLLLPLPPSFLLLVLHSAPIPDNIGEEGGINRTFAKFKTCKNIDKGQREGEEDEDGWVGFLFEARTFAAFLPSAV